MPADTGMTSEEWAGQPEARVAEHCSTTHRFRREDAALRLGREPRPRVGSAAA